MAVATTIIGKLWQVGRFCYTDRSFCVLH